MRLILKTCCCLLILTGIALAQSDRGTITGTVTDPAGAVVPGAAIKAKNVGTGTDYTTSATSTGNYTLSQLPVGNYELTVALSGFKTFVRQGITVLAAQTLRVDVSLEVGALTETVTVTEDAPLLKTESGELSHNVRTDTLDNIPVLSIGGSAGSTGIRNPYAVMQVLPGADWRPDASVRINGTPGNTQALRVEGQDSTNNMWQQMGQYTQQGVDAIQEVAVQTSNYSAEYGQAGTAVFNMTMKSGTNQIHGSAYLYEVNEALNAHPPYSKAEKPRARRHDYGFTFGGPVYLPKIWDGRDKTFFFFTFEQYRQASTAHSIGTVPTAKMRAGDFSEILGSQLVVGGQPLVDSFGNPVLENQLYDWTTEQVVNGVRAWKPFANNQIPQSLWDPAAVKIQAVMPPPSGSGLTNNYTFDTANTTLTYIPSVKIDHSISSRAKISGYWSRNSFISTADDGLPLSITGGVPNRFTSHTVRINFDYTINPTMLLHLGSGLVYNYYNQFPTQSDAAGTFGLTTQAHAFPYISGLLNGTYGGFSPAMGAVMNAQLANYKPTANPSLSWIHGNHSYKFGAELIVESHPSYSETFANNWFSFASSMTADPEFTLRSINLPTGKNIGFPYASFLTGRVSSGNTNAPSRGHLGDHSLAFYAQDSWKITPKITLDYGLRYDFQTYLREEYGRWGSFSPSVPNPKADNLPGAMMYEGYGPGHCNCAYANNYKYAFGPRIGLAWQMAPETVLRIGAGISYGRTPELGYLNNTLSNFVSFASTSPGAAITTLQAGPPFVVKWPNFDLTAPFAFPPLPSLSAMPVAIDHNAGRPPRTIQWSIGIQRELTRDLLVEVSYIGNRGVWWQAGPLIDVNGVTADYLLTEYGLDVVNSAADRALLTSSYASVVGNAAHPEYKTRFPLPFTNFPTGSQLIQALRPFPQFTSINFIWAPLGKTWYDSLQAKVTKRFSHNFDFTYSLTFQKEMTLGAETSYNLFATITPQINDVKNRDTNKYISGLSRPFMNVIAASYTTPKVFAGNKILSQVLRDWQISALLRYTSAQPIRVPGTSNNIGTLLARAVGTFANRVPGQPLFMDQNGNAIDINGNWDPQQTFVLNPAAWTDPPAGQFGTSTAYYNDYRGRRHPTENMSLARNFRLGKDGQYTLQLRAEFNNIFNRLYVPDPTSTSATATRTTGNGINTGGFGYINMTSNAVFNGVRTGQIVARFSF
jgi:hypothetical protein